MNQKEFKALDDKFVQVLSERLPDSDVKVRNDPFRGKLVGISYEKGGNIFEIFSLNNNGDEASWQFLGQGQL